MQGRCRVRAVPATDWLESKTTITRCKTQSYILIPSLNHFLLAPARLEMVRTCRRDSLQHTWSIFRLHSFNFNWFNTHIFNLPFIRHRVSLVNNFAERCDAKYGYRVDDTTYPALLPSIMLSVSKAFLWYEWTWMALLRESLSENTRSIVTPFFSHRTHILKRIRRLSNGPRQPNYPPPVLLSIFSSLDNASCRY